MIIIIIMCTIVIWGCFLLLSRDVDNNSPDPPSQLLLLSDAPPHCYQMPFLSSGGFKNARCMHIHTFVAPAAGSFWDLEIDMDQQLIDLL